MRIQQTFEVAATVDAVWAAFGDVAGIVPCLPGAQLTQDLGDGRYAGRVTVRLGPMSFGFEGEATLTSDPQTRSGTITGAGTDRKGGSRGSVRVAYTVRAPEGSGAPEGSAAGVAAGAAGGPITLVTLDTDLTLAGPAAQFGRTGLIEEVSRRLLAEFATCLGARLAAASPEEADAVRAAEVGAASLLAGIVTDRLRKSLGRDR